ncbi:hypothetical protein BBP40_006107 [Aspergillus hancockii]|nr:hypothetical protein BBP40_006107 [Aspergillus hancockii]
MEVYPMVSPNEVVCGVCIDSNANLSISYGKIRPNTAMVEPTGSTSGDSLIRVDTLFGITNGNASFLSDQFVVDSKYVIVGFKFSCKKGSSRLDPIVCEWDLKTGQLDWNGKQGKVLLASLPCATANMFSAVGRNELSFTEFDNDGQRGILRGFYLELELEEDPSGRILSAIHTTGIFWMTDTWLLGPPGIEAMVHTPVALD